MNPENIPPTDGPQRSSAEDKVIDILSEMKTRYPRFSLRLFLETLFTSKNRTITNYSEIFLAGNGVLPLMNTLFTKCSNKDGVQDWVIDKAASICARECSWLTDHASDGPHYSDAKLLRVTPEGVTVSLVESFRLSSLTGQYDRLTPYLQAFLRVVIGKNSIGESEGRTAGRGGRSAEDVRHIAFSSCIVEVRCRVVPLLQV